MNDQWIKTLLQLYHYLGGSVFEEFLCFLFTFPLKWTFRLRSKIWNLSAFFLTNVSLAEGERYSIQSFLNIEAWLRKLHCSNDERENQNLVSVYFRFLWNDRGFNYISKTYSSLDKNALLTATVSIHCLLLKDDWTVNSIIPCRLPQISNIK